MKNRKFAKKFGCILLATSLVLSGTNIPATSQAKTIAKYYNTKKTITFKDPKGIRKCLVNGKAKKIKAGTKKIKITFKKEGKYVVKITNRKKKVTTKTIYIDKTAPTITGVKHGETYTNAVSFAAKDKYGMSSFKVNGTKIKAPYKATVTETGTYELLAEDKAGNVRKLSFVISAGQPEATSGTAVSSGAMATTGPATNSQIPNAPALLPGNDNPGSPVLPGSDNSNSGTQDKIPTIGCNHLWILQSVEEEATCYSPGIAKYTCFSCGGTKRDELPKVAHDYSKLIADKRYEIKKEKCEETGEYYLCCKYCGEKGTEIGTVDALGHEYKKRISGSDYLKDPATLEHGNIYYLACVHCGEKGTDTWDDGALITHTEHTFTDTSVADDSNRATDATCTKPATYYYKCTGCNTFDTENKEHTFEAGDALGHEFSIRTLKEQATCDHGNRYDKKCSRPNCEEYEGKIEDDKKTIPHDFKATVADKEKYYCDEPTCDHGTVYYTSCTMCGLSSEKSGNPTTFNDKDKKEHDFKATVADKEKYYCDEPTCEHGTVYYTSCTMCGLSSEKSGNPTTFNEKDKKASCEYERISKDYKFSEPTCQNGTKYYKQCKWCKKSTKSVYESLHKKGVPDTDDRIEVLLWEDNDKSKYHTWIKTPTGNGDDIYKHRTCKSVTLCWPHCKWCTATKQIEKEAYEDTKEVYGPKLEHSLEQFNRVEATLTKDGTYCERCTREGCDFERGPIVDSKNAPHKDQYAPGIYWKYDYYKFITNSPQYHLGSGSYRYSDAAYVDAVEENSSMGDLYIHIKDSDSSTSGIRCAYAVIDYKNANNVHVWKDKFKNHFDEIKDKVIDLTYRYDSDNLSYRSHSIYLDPYATPANLSHISAKDCDTDGVFFVYIYAEDNAGNSTCIRTGNLYR